jgi:hypothetical protein
MDTILENTTNDSKKDSYKFYIFYMPKTVELF